MPRRPRVLVEGLTYHVDNRARRGEEPFKPEDEAGRFRLLPLLAYLQAKPQLQGCSGSSPRSSRGPNGEITIPGTHACADVSESCVGAACPPGARTDQLMGGTGRYQLQSESVTR